MPTLPVSVCEIRCANSCKSNMARQAKEKVASLHDGKGFPIGQKEGMWRADPVFQEVKSSVWEDNRLERFEFMIFLSDCDLGD
jgi:hypothetical protein